MATETNTTNTTDPTTIPAMAPVESELPLLLPLSAARTIAKYTPEAGTVPVAVVVVNITSESDNGVPTVYSPLLLTANAKSGTVYAGLIGIVGLIAMVRLLGYVTFPSPVLGNTAPDMI
jgi:hypothetical protein